MCSRHFPPHTERKFNCSLFPHFHFSTLKTYCFSPHAVQRKRTSQTWLHATLLLDLFSSSLIASPPHRQTSLPSLCFDLTPVFPVVEIPRALAPPAHCQVRRDWRQAEPSGAAAAHQFHRQAPLRTGLAPPHLLRSLFAREWPRSQHWLPPAASPGASRACGVGGWVQKYPQANPETRQSRAGREFGEQRSVGSRWQGRPWCGVTAGHPGLTCEIPQPLLTSSNPPLLLISPSPIRGWQMEATGGAGQNDEQDKKGLLRGKVLSWWIFCVLTYFQATGLCSCAIRKQFIF